MSSASIAEIKSYFIGNVGGDNRKAAEASGQDSFSRIFDKTNGNGEPVSDTKGSKTGTDDIYKHADIQKKNDSYRLQEKQQVAEEMLEEEMLEEAAVDAGAEMVQEVAKTFNMTVEEVEEVMQDLGLSPMDLLSGENLIKLVLGMNPEADSLTIMTNEQLFADLKGLMNTAQDLMDQMAGQFNMSQEELAKMFAVIEEKLLQQAAGQDEAQVLMEQPPVEQGLAGQAMVTQAEAQNADEQLPQIFTRMEAENGMKEQNASDGMGVTKESASYVEGVGNQTEKSGAHSESQGQETNQQPARDSFANNLINQLSQAVNESASVQTGFGVEGRDIISQITEYIKVTVKADTTQLELQLNPESLGSVKVQLTSKAGVLTAAFTTENEAVKAVLEAQMIQLKESFEQQGLKVDAVEVNVETRGFERSLDQQNEEANGFEQKEGKSRRRISLTGLESVEEELLSGEMSEGDKIVADMMLRNGNTVDYTV